MNDRNPTNFAHLEQHDAQLVRLGMLAERYFADDPNTCLLKLRQFAELLAQLVAANVGLYTAAEESQWELLRRLEDRNVIPQQVAQLFHQVRRSGNNANHQLADDRRTALAMLKVAWQLGVWFHRTFANAAFRSGPFMPPVAPRDESAELQAELDRLRHALTEYQATHQQTTEQLSTLEAKLREARDEQAFWEQMAVEADQAKAAMAQSLALVQRAGATHSKQRVDDLVRAAQNAAERVELDEFETRKLIDAQLRDAGWLADSETLSHRHGTRPEKGKNLAIAEWPTASGPADYVLFVGLMPIAAIEAKRKGLDAAGALEQAKRYSRTFCLEDDATRPGGPWDAFQLPFAFATNGRPYLRQLETRSGIWFCDLRRPDNLSRALDGWYTPEGLMELLRLDEDKAHTNLNQAGFNYGFPLRDYQRNAITAVEAAIARGARQILLAMATGTGKTKTCIALIYRLLSAQRFRRVLFLVDRSALGTQAADAFKETRMENLQTFADIFGIQELRDRQPDTATKVQIATIQGMMKRVLYANEGESPPIDQYDCIVVDECHRGYLLDRELSDTELEFRSFEEYISKYRRVLDYFDAVKIGLTATPALHTSQIFGQPIFTYSYREAVLDGYLVDCEPPKRIVTQLAIEGIVFEAGTEVEAYHPTDNRIESFTTPDEIRIEIDQFNRKVLNADFNRVVCEELARDIDPTAPGKTLVFCANDAHADLVVTMLKQAFAEQYGSIEDDAVIKITGTADRPLELIRRYKNERNPSVAVTVDLLTTGIDIPAICNLVFLRRVKSRILYEQMMGRATRLCPEIGKESFRVFDAVRLYEVLEKFSDMKPVAIDPNITFTQLALELGNVTSDEQRTLCRDQFIAKLQRKKRRLSEAQAEEFERVAGMPPDEFMRQLRSLPLAEVATWFTQNPALGEILDRQNTSQRPPILISNHADAVMSVERGYGNATKPEDYIQAFSEYVRSNSNTIPALMAVLTRPRELTRKELRELALALDRAGFNETSLDTAWREMTNQDIAARIVGYIRQAALGDALIPYDRRVDNALQTILSSRPWTEPQRQWLKRIAAQTKANLLVDRAAIDDPDLIFKREGGGFARLDRIFGGELAGVLAAFNEALWPPTAS